VGTFNIIPIDWLASFAQCARETEKGPLEDLALISFNLPIIYCALTLSIALILWAQIYLPYRQEQRQRDDNAGPSDQEKEGREKQKVVSSDEDHSSSSSLKFKRDKLICRFLKSLICMCLLLYPFISMSLLRIYDCRDLGLTGSFAKADYSIKCSGSNYTSLVVMCTFGIILYIIGIPLFFFLVIFYRDKYENLSVVSIILTGTINYLYVYVDISFNRILFIGLLYRELKAELVLL
jgi:hypothetical protein